MPAISLLMDLLIDFHWENLYSAYSRDYAEALNHLTPSLALVIGVGPKMADRCSSHSDSNRNNVDNLH